jgi:hypothetical protein
MKHEHEKARKQHEMEPAATMAKATTAISARSIRLPIT